MSITSQSLAPFGSCQPLRGSSEIMSILGWRRIARSLAEDSVELYSFRRWIDDVSGISCSFGAEWCECEGGTERGETVDNAICPFGRLEGVGGEVEICKPVGIGMLFRGIVSSRYGCSRHCLLVRRASGSYLSRSAMQSISLVGIDRSNNV